VPTNTNGCQYNGMTYGSCHSHSTQWLHSPQSKRPNSACTSKWPSPPVRGSNDSARSMVQNKSSHAADRPHANRTKPGRGNRPHRSIAPPPRRSHSHPQARQATTVTSTRVAPPTYSAPSSRCPSRRGGPRMASLARPTRSAGGRQTRPRAGHPASARTRRQRQRRPSWRPGGDETTRAAREREARRGVGRCGAGRRRRVRREGAGGTEAMTVRG